MPATSAPIQVTLLRPGAGASVNPGGQINGVGWFVSSLPVLSMDLTLGGVHLGRARVGIPPAHFAALTGHHAAEDQTGFVLIGTVPALPAGNATLTLNLATAEGVHEHHTPR